MESSSKFMMKNNRSSKGNYGDRNLEIQLYINRCKEIWWNSSEKVNFIDILGKEVNISEKKSKEKQLDEFINVILKKMEQCPSNKEKQQIWREEFYQCINEFNNKFNFINTEDNKDFFEGIKRTTNKFLKDSKSFNSGFGINDIIQAMRNVWIMNLLQWLFNIDVKYTQSIFAYSMLYPYTDNYLDSIEISDNEKEKINLRFKKRIQGDNIEPYNDYEKDIYKLFSIIEKEYPREEYLDIYDSLILIQKAQEESMRQKGRFIPYHKDVLGISFKKGGASVLSDAYLVLGTLSDEIKDFSFGYGTLLQLCDDLQDCLEDYEEWNMTIFSQTFKNWKLDSLTNKLINYLLKIIEKSNKITKDKDKSEFIFKNILYLIFSSIAENKNLYSRNYFRNIDRFCDVRLNYLKKFYSDIIKKQKKFSNIDGLDIYDIVLIVTE